MALLSLGTRHPFWPPLFFSSIPSHLHIAEPRWGWGRDMMSPECQAKDAELYLKWYEGSLAVWEPESDVMEACRGSSRRMWAWLAWEKARIREQLGDKSSRWVPPLPLPHSWSLLAFQRAWTLSLAIPESQVVLGSWFGHQWFYCLLAFAIHFSRNYVLHLLPSPYCTVQKAKSRFFLKSIFLSLMESFDLRLFPRLNL